MLVVALRRLGDVLLTTPLIRSVKRAFPASFDRCAGVCRHRRNFGRQSRSCRSPHHPAAPARRRNAGADAAALQALRPCAVDADRRPADILGRHRRAAKRRAGGSGRARSAVKRFALSRSYVSDRGQHRVLDILRLAELHRHSRAGRDRLSRRRRCARRSRRRSPTPSIHAAPMFTYKRWTAPAGGRLLRRCASAASARSSPAPRPIAPISMTSGTTASRPSRRQARLAGTVRFDRRRARLYRAGHRHHPSCRRHRHADRRALWPDRSAAVGTVAARRARPPMGCRRHDPASRQCLAGAKSAARACRASWKAASAGSTATANVSTSLQPVRSCPRSIRRWRCGRRRSG